MLVTKKPCRALLHIRIYLNLKKQKGVIIRFVIVSVSQCIKIVLSQEIIPTGRRGEFIWTEKKIFIYFLWIKCIPGQWTIKRKAEITCTILCPQIYKKLFNSQLNGTIKTFKNCQFHQCYARKILFACLFEVYFLQCKELTKILV